jgi:hypothetical protein
MNFGQLMLKFQKESVSMIMRSKSFKIAAVLVTALSVLGVASALRILAAGREGLPALPGSAEAGGPPFWAGVMFLTLAICGFFSAYGLWNNQKWGKVVAVVFAVINGLFSLGDLLGFLSLGMILPALGFFVIVLADILIILLVLRPEPKAATQKMSV